MPVSALDEEDGGGRVDGVTATHGWIYVIPFSLVEHSYFEDLYLPIIDDDLAGRGQGCVLSEPW